MKMSIRFTATLALVWLSVFTLNAQSDVMPFSRMEQSVSRLSRGGAGLTDSEDAFAPFSNAAAMPYSVSTMNAGVSYLRLRPGTAAENRTSVGAVFKIGKSFGIGGGAAYGKSSPYETADESGDVSGTFRPSDLQLNIGAGWRFLQFLSIGADLKYFRSTVANGISYGTVATDIFLMSQWRGLSIAAGVSTLGGKVKSESGDSFSLPASFDFGLGYDLSFGKRHAVDFCADLNCFFSGKTAVSAGFGYTWNSMLTVRCGYRYGGRSVVPSYASAGLGVRFFGVSLDAAWLFGSAVLKNSFGLSLSYGF